MSQWWRGHTGPGVARGSPEVLPGHHGRPPRSTALERVRVAPRGRLRVPCFLADPPRLALPRPGPDSMSSRPQGTGGSRGSPSTPSRSTVPREETSGKRQGLYTGDRAGALGTRTPPAGGRSWCSRCGRLSPHLMPGALGFWTGSRGPRLSGERWAGRPWRRPKVPPIASPQPLGPWGSECRRARLSHPGQR